MVGLFHNQWCLCESCCASWVQWFAVCWWLQLSLRFTLPPDCVLTGTVLGSGGNLPCV